MPRIANYLTIYWTHPAYTRLTSLLPLLGDLLDTLPELTLSYCGKKPPSKITSPRITTSINKLKSLLPESDPDKSAFLNIKSSEVEVFNSDFHLVVGLSNRVYVPSQKTWIPNYLLLYFPANIHEERLAIIASWFANACAILDCCYAYLNPVVHYDMFNVASDNQQILELLRLHPVVDVFDDFNQFRYFCDHVKGPSWITVLSEKHLHRLKELETEECIAFTQTQLSSSLRMFQMSAPLSAHDIKSHKVLAELLDPITIASFSPVLLRFPYKFPRNYANEWLRRFRCETVWPWID